MTDTPFSIQFAKEDVGHETVAPETIIAPSYPLQIYGGNSAVDPWDRTQSTCDYIVTCNQSSHLADNVVVQVLKLYKITHFNFVVITTT